MFIQNRRTRKKNTHTCQTRKCTSTTCTHRFGHTVTGKPPSVKDSPCAMKHRMSRCDILSNYTRHSHDTNYVYLVRKHMRIRASASMVIVIVEVHTKAQTWSSSTCVCALSNVIWQHELERSSVNQKTHRLVWHTTCTQTQCKTPHTRKKK